MRFTLFVLLFVLALTDALPGQTAARSATTASLSSQEVLSRAQSLLLASYPELASRPLSVTMRAVGRRAILRWTPTTPEPLERRAEKSEEVLLSAIVDFDDDGLLERLIVDGQLAESARSRELFAKAIAEPEWSLANVESWLASHGGRAKEAVRLKARPDPERWQQALGSQLSIADSEFRMKRRPSAGPSAAASPSPNGRMTREGPSGNPPVTNQPLPDTLPEPGWFAEVRATSRKGRPIQYLFRFEPFDGRLVEVVRQ